MPGGDRTGPAGHGPKTGRGLGYCSGYSIMGSTRGVFCKPGRGGGIIPGKSGRGRGFRYMYWDTGLPGWLRPIIWNIDQDTPNSTPKVPGLTPEMEKEVLADQARALEVQLQGILQRIRELHIGETEQSDPT